MIFGDSYSDDSRLGYFISHNGSAPPTGWVDPASYHASTGGRIWGQYVLQYSSAAHLYNYAVSGAVCSNEITPRYFSAIDAPFPAIAQYEVPAYLADAAYVKPDGEKFVKGTPDTTVYAIWIGTNDLGYYAFVQDEQVAGTNLTSYVDCVYESLKRVYDSGGRYFVIFNNAPLWWAPEYAAPPYDVGPNQYWPDKPANHTLIEQRMVEEVVTVVSPAQAARGTYGMRKLTAVRVPPTERHLQIPHPRRSRPRAQLARCALRRLRRQRPRTSPFPTHSPPMTPLN